MQYVVRNPEKPATLGANAIIMVKYPILDGPVLLLWLCDFIVLMFLWLLLVASLLIIMAFCAELLF